jgi:ankyrin repeat protein
MIYILYKACRQGHIEIVKEFLNHNANLGAKDYDWNTPFIQGIFFYYYLIWKNDLYFV